MPRVAIREQTTDNFLGQHYVEIRYSDLKVRYYFGLKNAQEIVIQDEEAKRLRTISRKTCPTTYEAAKRFAQNQIRKINRTLPSSQQITLENHVQHS